MSEDPTKLSFTFDEYAERAMKGERSDPFPGNKYYLNAVHLASGKMLLLPIPFDSPEEAIHVAVVMSPMLSDDCEYEVVILPKGGIE